MTEPNNAAVYREIDDDLRHMQMKKFWDENRLWIAATIVLAIVATGAVTFWRGHIEKKNMAATAQMMTALATPGGIQALVADPSVLDRPAHVALVRLAAADRQLRQGKMEEALATYDALAADRSADPTFRDLGRLYAVGLRLQNGKADELDKQLTPLAREGEPWRFTALEMQALLYAREGRMQDAAAKMAEISGDAAAPEDARTRAFTLRELYQADAANAAQDKK